MADRDRGKGKASKSRPSKLHLRRPSHITPTCILSPSPALSPARTSHAAPQPRTSHPTPPSRSSHVTPPPSMRRVESPSNQQPSYSEEGPTPGSSETVVALETQSNGGKPILYLEGQGFLPSYLAANSIGDILKSHYTDPWPSWKKIPRMTR